MHNSRVILLGFPKTGNTTIHNTLRHLGYDFIQHWDDVEPQHTAEPDDIAASHKQLLNIPENTGVALGTLGQLNLWEQYTLRYPDALYVLNTRSNRSHLTSLLKHAWYDYTENSNNSTWGPGYWPPTAYRGFHRLIQKHRHETDVEKNIRDVQFLKVDIESAEWQHTLVKKLDPSADINKLLTTGYSYPGFQQHSDQTNSGITGLHANARPDSILPQEDMALIQSAVSVSLEAFELHKASTEIELEIAQLIGPNPA